MSFVRPDKWVKLDLELAFLDFSEGNLMAT